MVTKQIENTTFKEVTNNELIEGIKKVLLNSNQSLHVLTAKEIAITETKNSYWITFINDEDIGYKWLTMEK